MSLKINSEKEFKDLFDRYYDELCRVVVSVVKDTAIAEDAVQEVFVNLWLRRHEISINTSFKGYLYKAVIFKGLDEIRKQKTKTNAHEDLKVLYPQSHNDVEARVTKKELNQAIETCLEKMPENMRVIFKLSRFGGLKNREIAEELNISIKTVESNMTKAFKLMHEQLKPYMNNNYLVFWTLVNYLINR